MSTARPTKDFTYKQITIASTKPYAQVIQDLEAQLGKGSTQGLADKVETSKDWDEFKEKVEPEVGSSGFINVAEVNWGEVMSLVPLSLKAKIYIIGNPLTARKVLEHLPEVGQYLPTKIYVYEDKQGVTQVAYDAISPVFSQYGNEDVNKVGAEIDKELKKLADAAAH